VDVGALCSTPEQGHVTITAGAIPNTQLDGPPVVTITLNVQVLVLPHASIAVHVTAFVPGRNVDPEGGLYVTVTVPEQLSVTVAWYVATAPFVEVASTVMSPGHWMTGG
jgi:hypothetical protein